MKVKISIEEAKRFLEFEELDLPKYVPSILNLANKFSQGTRPKVVGQMTELIQQFSGRTIEEWEEWYQQQQPNGISKATDKIYSMMLSFKYALDDTDREKVQKWVKDLVIFKTYIGLRSQEAILKKGAELLDTDCRLATPEEESKGIDGYIGTIPVSIKPDTYKTQDSLVEIINAKLIYYSKDRKGFVVDYSQIIV